MLLATGGGIAWHALDVLMGVWTAVPEGVNQSLAHQHIHGHHHGVGGHHHGIDMDHPVLALNMTILSIAVKEGLYWITKRAGERTGSGLMKANAWHHRADAVSSLVALIGVGNNLNLHNSYKVSLCATMFSSLRNTTMYMLIALIVFLVLEVYLCFLPITTALLNLMILS
nr:metal tolerance protein 2 [Ipomoea batatas]